MPACREVLRKGIFFIYIGHSDQLLTTPTKARVSAYGFSGAAVDLSLSLRRIGWDQPSNTPVVLNASVIHCFQKQLCNRILFRFSPFGSKAAEINTEPCVFTVQIHPLCARMCAHTHTHSLCVLYCLLALMGETPPCCCRPALEPLFSLISPQINVHVTTMDAELEFAIQPSTLGKQLVEQVLHQF